jgi:hypothetical protein
MTNKSRDVLSSQRGCEQDLEGVEEQIYSIYRTDVTENLRRPMRSAE